MLKQSTSTEQPQLDFSEEQSQKPKCRRKKYCEQLRMPNAKWRKYPLGSDAASILHGRWKNMRNRCYKPSEVGYKNYGGRGVTVCDEWRNSYEPFRSWALANGFEEHLTLDRKDNDKPYSPDNCQWATRKAQQNNRRVNVMLTAFGETKTMAQWIEDPRCTVTRSTIKKRIIRGMSVEYAISTPPLPQYQTSKPRTRL